MPTFTTLDIQTTPMKTQLSLFATAFALSLAAQPATFNPRGIGAGGAFFSPAINPANTNEYFVASDMTELFHTTDFGLSYSQAHFTQFSAGHASKVCYTNASGILYSIQYITDIATPCMSADNGVSWTTFFGNPDPNENVYTIHADYNNPSRIIISQYGAIYYSNNNGVSFNLIHTALDNGAGNVIGGVFFDGTTIFIGTNDGVLVSTDGGNTWNTANLTGINSAERIWSFCAGKSGNTTRLFCLTGDVNDIYVGLVGSDYYGFFRNVYSCDYGSGNWVNATNNISVNDFPMFIDMAENDINTVYLAGSNTAAEPIILKTTNAGGSWANTFITTNNQNITTGWSGAGGDRGWTYGECPFGFDVAATNANVLIYGDYGFVHKTNDGGTSWKQGYVLTTDEHASGANTPQGQTYHSIGLENTTNWQVHWMNANTIWGCFSDIRGVRSTDGGNGWAYDYTGHTANSSYRMAQMANGTQIMACSGIHDMYQSTRLTDALLDANDAAGQLKYSTDNGLTWQVLHSFGHPVYWIALDPNNPNRAYASVIHYGGGTGVGGVYRCDDLNNLAASTWTLLADPPRTEKHPASLTVLNDGSLLASYSARRNGSGTFTASSGVFIYNPTLNSWADVSDADMYYWMQDVVIDPNDANQNTWYACVFSGWGGPPNGLGGLYKTTNRGQTWVKLTGSTIDRVMSCTFNPNNASEMYLTTEGQGLWMSSNINAATPVFTMVYAYPFRQPTRVFFNPYNPQEIWVSSFGNGMRMGNLNSMGLTNLEQPTFNLFPNPASEQVTVNGKSGELICIYNLQGQIVYQDKMENTIMEIDLHPFAEGVYVVEVGMKKEKLIIQHN
jgi:photosystem II stability/assembly factor-like uncharacterized protein